MNFLNLFQKTYIFFNSIFELLQDSNSCQNIEDDAGLFKPYVTDFDYKLSLENYLDMKKRKGAYVLLAGQKAWIKKIEYRHLKKSVLYLIHKDSHC